MLFSKIIAVYCENIAKDIYVYALCEQHAEIFNVKLDGIYSYHSAVEG
jgi:hypothetical protein